MLREISLYTFYERLPFARMSRFPIHKDENLIGFSYFNSTT